MRFLTTLPFLTLTLSIFLTASSSYAEVFYKWEDDSGSWVYGEHPPLGVEAIEIKTHSNRNNDSDSKKDELAIRLRMLKKPQSSSVSFIVSKLEKTLRLYRVKRQYSSAMMPAM